MHKEWRRGDSFHALANPAHEIGQSFVSPGIQFRHIPDTNKRKRDESEAFFAQEKLLIEYWVSR